MKLLGIAVRDASKLPMRLISKAEVSIDKGIIEDFRGKSLKRQITMMSLVDWESACNEINVNLPWYLRRANLLIDSVKFSELSIGQKITFDEVCLEVVMECDPCHRLQAIHPDLKKALTTDWRGGACCRVMKSGVINVGEKLSVPNMELITGSYIHIQ